MGRCYGTQGTASAARASTTGSAGLTGTYTQTADPTTESSRRRGVAFTFKPAREPTAIISSTLKKNYDIREKRPMPKPRNN